jgi:uncharacterized phosphatase
MSDKQIVLLAARHGRTTLNKNNCFRGDANPPLDETGFREANISGHYLKGFELGDVYSSPKTRATQTADAITRQIGKKDYEEICDLVALDVGDFSGKPKSPENVSKIGEYINNPSVPIPGGESLDEFRDRVRPIFVEAIEKWEQTGLPCLIVVHSSIIHELGQMFNDDHHSARVEPGGVAAVYYDDGRFHAEPIFKPLKKSGNKVDTIS